MRRELDDEMRFHVEMLERDRAALGMSASHARADALRQFGRRASLREESLGIWHLDLVDALVQDAVLALRMLPRNRVFAIVAILTLAIAIGLATAMATIVEGILLRPLSIPDESRVVLIEKRAPTDVSLRPFAVLDLLALEQERRTFVDVAGVQYDGAFPYPMRDGDRVRSVVGSIVSSEFFRVLGTRAAAGRLLEKRDGFDGAPVAAVISYGFWRREYGGDPHIVGRTVRFVGSSPTIVGVAPRGFEYPNGVEIWLAMRFDREALTSRSVRPFAILARLAPRTTISDAQSAAEAFVHRQETTYAPDEAKGQRPTVITLRDALVGKVKPSILVLSIAVSLLFLLAAINVANLFLVRATGRQQELAMRGAVGAPRGRLVRQLVTESGVVALCASILGAGLAFSFVRLIVLLAPVDFPRLSDVHVDALTLLFAIIAGSVCSVVTGLLPSLWILRNESFGALRIGARAGRDSVGTRRLKNALVASQLSLAVVLVAAAMLLGRSVNELATSNPGYAVSRLTLVSLAVPASLTTPPTRLLNLYNELATRVATAPGIDAVTPLMIEPFTGSGGWDATFSLTGQSSADASGNPTLDMQVIAPGYFGTMGVPLLRGREFNISDREGGLPVAILSEAAAAHAWPGKEALGRQIKIGPPEGPEPWRTTVGIAHDTRYRDLSLEIPMVYLPFSQDAGSILPSYLAVRAKADPSTIRNIVRAAAGELDASVLVVESRPFKQLMSVPLARPRVDSTLVGVFSLVALLLAALGLYGTLSSMVGQRTPELGVRMALGAAPPQVRWLVVGAGLRLMVVGTGCGLTATLAATKLLRSALFGVSPNDPWTLTLVVLVLFVTCILACLFPALRASRIDPLGALRAD